MLQVAVIGIPDKRLGENIAACIISTAGVLLTEEEVLAHFNEMYKTDEGLGITPAYFMFMEEFPKVNGKVDKKTLKKMAIEKYNLE